MRDVTLRPATQDDCRPMWQWRNEPATRQASFNTEPIRWEVHVEWYASKLSDPRFCLRVVLDEARRSIGYVRFDLLDDAAEISLALAPEARGRGYGALAIRRASDDLLRSGAAARVVAHVRPENAVSVRAFRAAGFVPNGTAELRASKPWSSSTRPRAWSPKPSALLCSRCERFS